MKKMLVADNSDMNTMILRELFGKEYDFIQTNSSEEFLRLLIHYKDNIDVILVNETIAQKIPPEKIEILEKLNVFKNTPVILILNREHSNLKNIIYLPYSDVVHSPVNPYTVRKRVQNLAELFSHKHLLEQQVAQQMKKIVEQNKALALKQKKINSINNDMLDVLSMVIEYRDVESGKHIRRIQKFTEVLLRELAVKYPKYNLDEEKIALITSASSMHDIGKIAVPDAILLKPGRLTREEFQVMKLHTTKGCEILEQIDAVEKNDYYRYCYDICRYHHEKWDGLGYPDGLAGDEIPIWAQVVSLADCYDALTSHRPYKEAYPHEKAVDMIRDGACGTFSPELLDCFSMVLPKFKELSARYADSTVSHDNTASQYVRQQQSSYAEEAYLKMDRNDLIAMIEHQKQLLAQTRQKDAEIYYAGTDYVFEFDLLYDTVHERKGSMKDICGFIPKNYEEAVRLFAENCQEDYRNDFNRRFRLKNIGQSAVIMECMMKLNKGNDTSVRVTAVPVFSDGKLTHIFIGIIELHDTLLNHIRQTSQDHDVITGLWNLNGISREIDDYLQNTGKNGYHLMVLVDGDDFKKINRSTSYKFGNEILAALSKAMRMQIPDSSLTARIEDDNFIIFIKDCPDKDECIQLVQDIFRAYARSFTFNDTVTIHTTASVGAVVYPFDGHDFQELFANVSKTVELVKLNGKNMYMFYNDNMKDDWEIEPYPTTDNAQLVCQNSSLQSVDLQKYLVPVIHSANGDTISYDFIETVHSHIQDFSYLYDFYSDNLAVFTLNSLQRLLAEIFSMQQDNITLPKLSLITAFESDDCENIIAALGKILKQYPLHHHHICLMISQSMTDNISPNKLAAFSAALKSMGFSLGVYDVGAKYFNIKCFSDSFFDTIVFADSFIKEVSEGIYPAELLAYFIGYFYKMGISAELPSSVSDELITILRQKTAVPFGIHKGHLIPLDDFRTQIMQSSAVIHYPVLSHENTSLVLSEKIYDEVLVQTKSFILEWTPRFDKIKISGSFRKLYGYEPVSDDFVKSLYQSNFLHSDDIPKFLDKINAVRSDNGYSEAFVRISDKQSRSYIWHKVKFVAIRNTANIPVKIIAVFADVSDESATFLDDSRKDRTDFITNLYNKRVTENKIKNCLYDNTQYTSHALILAEIVGYELLEEHLGSIFANAVLKETAENIRELFRDSDIIGKSTGNRFMIFVKGMNYGEKLIEKAEQVCLVIKNKYQSDNGDITITGKAGISIFPHDGQTYDELYANAFNALETAKHSSHSIAFVSDTLSHQKRLTETVSPN